MTPSIPSYPYELPLETKSDSDPAAVRFTGPRPRDFLLQCGRCTDWINHSAISIDGATRSALKSHHSKSECKIVHRLILSGSLKPVFQNTSGALFILIEHFMIHAHIGS
jgi:hypothetical protein